MTKPQINLLRSVIQSEVQFWRAKAENDWPLPKREVEVGRIAGVDIRTARSLVEAGLLDYAGSDNPRQTWVKLAYEPYRDEWTG